jgi:hypothetical protein
MTSGRCGAGERGPRAVPDQPTADGERQTVGIRGVHHRRRHGGQPPAPGDVEECGEHGLVGGMTVVVAEPDPLRTQGERVQHAQRETAGATEVVPGRQPGGRDPAGLDDLAGRLVGTVVDDDQVRDRVGLLGHRRERVDEQLGTVPGDHDRDDRTGGQGPVRPTVARRCRTLAHRRSSSASTSRPL